MPPRVYVRGSGGERSWCPPRRERGAGSPTIGVMEPRTDADVVIVGGSLGGCAAARRLALAGARVVVIEQRPGRAAYKRLCGHYIQAGATPEIERLGLVAPLEAAGAVRNAVDVCTPAGWIRRPALPHGYSIRREVLDPLVRRLATETPGVTYRGGLAVRDLVREGGRVIGVVATDRDGRPAAFRARLVVAADGRRSTVARLAGVPAASAPNHRCCFFAYSRGLDEPGRVWRLGRDVGGRSERQRADDPRALRPPRSAAGAHRDSTAACAPRSARSPRRPPSIADGASQRSSATRST